jgi:hypothetical protein
MTRGAALSRSRPWPRPASLTLPPDVAHKGHVGRWPRCVRGALPA